MIDDPKDNVQTKYADVIKDNETVYGRIMNIQVYPLEESPTRGNIDVDLFLDNNQIMECSVPADMFKTLQIRAFDPALFVVSKKISNDRYNCTAILFAKKTQLYAA